jgi:predicted methyltransferase
MKTAYRLVLAASLAMGCFAAWAAADIPGYISAAVANPDRPAADTARDAARHPAELIAFAGLKPGDQVIDFIPGGGYFTRIFANVVGPKGRVYAITPSELAAKVPKMAQAMVELAEQPAFSNVVPLVQPVAVTGDGGSVDMVWTSDNYHDIYGFFGPDHAAAADAAIFSALKPGGVFMVIDHVALPGASGTAPTTLHRIDPETVKAQVLAAGFKLEAQNEILKNPADPHTEKVFAPDIRGHTDQFVFKFRKPT